MNIPVKIGNKVAYIRSDPKNYILCQDFPVVNSKTGETKMKTKHLGFYGSLNALMESLLGMKVRTSTATTLEELKIDMKRAKEEVLGYWETTLKDTE